MSTSLAIVKMTLENIDTILFKILQKTESPTSKKFNFKLTE